jgi:hypothetical protein
MSLRQLGLLCNPLAQAIELGEKECPTRAMITWPSLIESRFRAESCRAGGGAVVDPCISGTAGDARATGYLGIYRGRRGRRGGGDHQLLP